MTAIDRAALARGVFRGRVSSLIAGLLVLIVGCEDPGEDARRQFEDVTLTSGLPGQVGMTYGAFWGDYDADGRPDLYVTNHLNDAQLFRNLGNGRFADVSSAVFSAEDLVGDKHGAAWGDFDNDGDLDLVQLRGAGRGVGAEPKRLFRNHGGVFHDVAEEMGVTNPQSRTRMPLWVDANSDGRLDLFHGAEGRFDQVQPPYFFTQEGEVFEAAEDAIAFDARSVPFCIVTNLNADPASELVCRAMGSQLTARIFDTATVRARELDLLPVTAFEDAAAGDFDNDEQMDLFLARKSFAGPVALGRSGSNTLIADIVVNAGGNGEPLGLQFRTDGQVDFEVVPAWPRHVLEPRHVRLGSQGWSPQRLRFSASAETAGIAGLATDQDESAPVVQVGLAGISQWRVLVSPPGGPKGKEHRVAIRIVSSEPITETEAVGVELRDEAAPARLFMNRDGALVDESRRLGANGQVVPGVNTVAGDFDNDMDVDLFVLASGALANYPNLMLWNRGDGHFERDPKAGGAAGTLSGVGDSVTTVDYDGDGFLDLFITAGGSMGRSLGLPSDGGSYHLYRNTGNYNRWLMIDLVGTRSNRDGIGALVRVSSGGVTQTRVQDGGVHHRGQNHQRLHFGLGKHEEVDAVYVHWPSGVEQELGSVAANQILRIEEPLR